MRLACQSPPLIVHPSIAAPLGALDAAGVRWCLLRGAGQLRRVDGDVDLLVHRRDVPILRRVLTSGGRFAELPAWGRRPHRFFAAHIASPDAWLKLDVVTELAFGRYHELRTRAAEDVLARRIHDGVLARPAPADAFWALLLHALLDRGAVRLERAQELIALAGPARGVDAPLAELADRACPPGWSAGRMLDAAAAGRFGELVALAPAIRAGWPDAPFVVTAGRSSLRRVLRRVASQQRGRMTSKSRSRSTG
jgi:hypothetical protein